MPANTDKRRLWPKRLGWLVLIWSLSVAALGVTAFVIRALMNAAGLTA